MAKDIEKLKKQLEGKTLEELANNAGTNENQEVKEISDEFLDNRDYDNYDYYEVDLKKGSKKNYVIMFLLYLIVIALIVLIFMAIKYKDQIKNFSFDRISYEIKN